MQTFLPHSDYYVCARVLDRKRLGKQRVEAYQILRVIEASQNDKRVAWSNHPAVQLWMQHPFWLVLYLEIMMEEWDRRGYRNSLMNDHLPEMKKLFPYSNMPPEFSTELHESHVSVLLQKDFEHYSKVFHQNCIYVPPDWETRSYVWSPPR